MINLLLVYTSFLSILVFGFACGVGITVWISVSFNRIFKYHVLIKALVIGFATIIIFLENLNYIGFGTRQSTPYLIYLAFLSALFGWRYTKKINFIDFSGTEYKYNEYNYVKIIIFFSFLIPLLYSLQFIEIHPFGFSAANNPDSFNQVSVANFLRENSFLESVNQELNQPWATPIHRYQVVHTRIGGSLLVAFFADLLNRDPREVFYLAQYVALFLLICVTYIGLVENLNYSPKSATISAIFLGSNGLIAHQFFNAGIPFLLSLPFYIYSITTIVPIVKSDDPFRAIKPYIVPSSISLVAGVSIYPEFLPFFTILAVGYVFISGCKNYLLLAQNCLIWMLLSISLNFYRIYTLYPNIKHQASANPGGEYLRVFLVDWLLLPLGFIPYDSRNSLFFQIFGSLGVYFLAVLAIIIVFIILWSVYKRFRQTEKLLWLQLVIYLAFIIYFLLTKDNEYSVVRVIMYALFPLAALSGYAVSNLNCHRYYLALLVGTIFLLNISSGVTFALAHTSWLKIIYSNEKREFHQNYDAVKELSEIKNIIPDFSSVILVEETRPSFQIWIAYYLRKFPLRYTSHNDYLHSRNNVSGSSYSYVLKYSGEENTLRSIQNKVDGDNIIKIIGNNAYPLWKNSQYMLFKAPLSYATVVLEDGFYSEEKIGDSYFRWIKKSAFFRISLPSNITSVRMKMKVRDENELNIFIDGVKVANYMLSPRYTWIDFSLPEYDDGKKNVDIHLLFSKTFDQVETDSRELYAMVSSIEIIAKEDEDNERKRIFKRF